MSELRNPAKSKGNRNKAAALQVEMSEMNYQSEEMYVSSLYQQAAQRYIRSQANLNYYQTVALVNAVLIEKQSATAYGAGEIGYTEHLMNIQQVISIKENYLNATIEYNQSVIYMEYLMAR